MQLKLEAKEYQEKIAELESTVEKLRHELRLLREAGSDASGSTLSESETTTEDQGAQQEEVNAECFKLCCSHLSKLHTVYKINKNTFCGTWCLSHCCSLLLSAVASIFIFILHCIVINFFRSDFAVRYSVDYCY